MVFINKPNKPQDNPKNYRPICLLEVILKLFEKIITQRLIYFLEYHHILSEKQFGFRPYRSTNHVIALLHQAIESLAKTGKSILICTRDVEKAFDTVWHRGLLYKLNLLFPNSFEVLNLIQQFLISRVITPTFNNQAGNVIIPQAGVPQGSSLGPILFLIYVNDHPSPSFNDTIITQFADDLIHVVSSDGTGKYKTLQAKQKLEKELQVTRSWEIKWKIRTNISKCLINTIGTTPAMLGKFGGITLNQQQIPISGSNKLLGYQITHRKAGSLHTNSVISKAKYSLHRIRRFHSAPPKIKLIFYKTLIRPILEYPTYPLTKISKSNQIKLQILQNNCLRFVKGVKLSARKNITDMHHDLKVDPLNIRLSKLNNKIINKMKDLYFPTNGTIAPDDACYKYGDFIISTPPLNKKKLTIAQRINKFIIKPNHHPNVIKDVPSPATWEPPDPIYKRRQNQRQNNNN